jgi:signal transduction histidine kinase
MLGLTIFTATIIYRYQLKQNIYFRNLEKIKVVHENELLQSQLEIQEQTFQNISREIHDNIGQKLTLVKLQLNTAGHLGKETAIFIMNPVNIISEIINELTDISHSLSSENILNNGLIKALEFEALQLEKSGLFTISIFITGDTVFLNFNKELVLFRIVQEAINNIIKHAEAKIIGIHLHYGKQLLTMQIADNGKGFILPGNNTGTGLKNIRKRASLLNGRLNLKSAPGEGTKLNIQIPLYDNNTNA